MADRPVLALDIGATRLRAATVDPTGRIIAAARMSTPRGAGVDAEVLWRTVLALIERVQLRSSMEFSGIGVGCAGPMRWPVGEVSPLYLEAWRDFPLRKRLTAEFPRIPIRVHNHGSCVAAGEHWRGAGRAADNVLGMVVSTGVGGGLVLDGRLVNGASGNAGHIGHVVVDFSGPACVCGGNGCLEAVASGPRLARWATAQGWRTGPGGTARDLLDDAGRGHPVAQAALQRAGRALGIALASVTHLCDLEVVAVGGRLSQAGPLLFKPLEEHFRRHAWLEYAREVRIVPAELGQEAGLIGAAALVLGGDQYWAGD